VILVDDRHRILFANKAVERTFGVRRDEIVGGYCPKVFHGADGPIQGCPLEEATEKGETVERELYHPPTRRWFLSGVYPTGRKTPDGHDMYVHTTRDVTESRRAREWLAKVNETFLSFGPHASENTGRVTKLCCELLKADCAFYCRSSDGAVFPAGPLAASGGPGEEALKGRVCREILEAAGDEPVVMRNLPALPGVGPAIRTCVGKAVRRAGAGAPAGALCAGFAGDFAPEESELKLMGILASAVAVEEARRKADGELNRTREQLWLSQKLEAVGRLAGGVAHDFNNLLTVITGSCNLASMRVSDERAKLDLDAVLDAANRASSLTRQLLAFSRKQVMQPRIMDLNETVTEASSMLRRLIGEDIEFATRLADGLGRVNADPSQLGQVILNLAVNARDAMPAGGKLLIETKNVDLDAAYAARRVVVKPGPYVMLAVTDTGEGMSEETQAHLFEPFFTTKAPGKGTGLGLSTVYGIVKQSGGYVWVYSEPGRGTAFKVYLPRVEGEVEPARPKTRSLVELPRGHETVLVVEDKPSLLSLARRILEMGGYRVLAAKDGNEALKRCREHDGAIHIMVTDVVMPGMGGRTLAEIVRELHPGIKVLFVSGYTNEAVQRHGALMADSEFLEKPFSASGLLRKVRKVLG